jgi:hypothetical protein
MQLSGFSEFFLGELQQLAHGALSIVKSGLYQSLISAHQNVQVGLGGSAAIGQFKRTSI